MDYYRRDVILIRERICQAGFFLNTNSLTDGYRSYVSIGDDVNSLSGCWRTDDVNHYEKLFDSRTIEDISIITSTCLRFEVLLHKPPLLRWKDGFAVV